MTKRIASVVPAMVLLLLIDPFGASSRAGSIGGNGAVRYGVSKRRGFDRCAAPTQSQMQTWWNKSPYRDVGIYIGGVNRYCAQDNLNSTWTTNVHNQGWSYYLTWVGPQAPAPAGQTRCSSAAHAGGYISADPTTARSEGRSQALRAVDAARSLGFTGINIIYYDMEPYDKTRSVCKNAVNAFIDGWVYRLHNHPYAYNQKAGVYAGPCTSNMSDWWSIANPPDGIWWARWNADPDVWGAGCGLTDSMWSGSRRLHQWAHITETWGGVAFTIDKNCAKGLVTPAQHITAEETMCTQE